MCLLFVKPADATLTDAQLRDMFSRNKDGYGVMYSEDNLLVVDKHIGSCEDWIEFFRSHEHRAMAVHLRMRTHGAVDRENTHPYPVYGFDGHDVVLPVAMCHNGILHHGNYADTTKSDTWHYIRDIIMPLTKNDPEVIFSKAFKDVISDNIGSSNKFVFMDNTGRTAIMNESAGVKWNNIWFSNTYAWNPYDEVVYPGAREACKLGKRYPVTSGGSYSGAGAWDGYDEVYSPSKRKEGDKVANGSYQYVNGILKFVPDAHSKTVNAPKKSLYKEPVVSMKKRRGGKHQKVQQQTALPLPSAGNGKWDANHRLEDVDGNVMQIRPRKEPLIEQLPSVWTPPPQMIEHDPEPVLHIADDVEYILELLSEELPLAALAITIDQIESLLKSYGVFQVEKMLENAVSGPIDKRVTELQVREIFTNKIKAATYFSIMDKSVDAM